MEVALFDTRYITTMNTVPYRLRFIDEKPENLGYQSTMVNYKMHKKYYINLHSSTLTAKSQKCI